MAVAVVRSEVAVFRALFFVLAVAASVMTSAQSASAAPPLPQPAVNWTGFYVGGNFGYGVGQTRSVPQDPASLSFTRLSPSGMVGGGQAGYRFQYNWIVLGAEADFQWSTQKDSICLLGATSGCQPLFTTFRSSRLDWFGTVRGVVGLAHDNWLWTFTGGYAYGSVEDQAGGFFLGNGQIAFDSDRATMAGWTIGTGVETRLGASNWSVKLEYLYLNLGRHTVNPQCASTSDNNGARPFCDAPPSSQALPVDSTFSDHVIRIGLNYNIGGTRTVAQPASPSTTVAANWTGFYAGGNFGYGVGHDGLDIQRFATDGTPTRTLFNLTQSPAGVIGGAQAGYRLQRGWLVIGAEADFQWSKQKDTSCINCTGAAINYDEKRDWFGTVRGVVGVAQNSWLWYVTGGFAYGRVAIDHNVPAGDFILARSHSTEIGWAAGAGVETKLGSSNWSARFEYLYMDLGTVSFDSICSANTAGLFGLQVGRCEALTNTITDHIFRVGLNYQFGSYSR